MCPIFLRQGNPARGRDQIDRVRTKSAAFPDGVPIYVDPLGLSEADKTMASPVVFDVKKVPLGTSLTLMLKQIGLTYRVKDGLLTITSQESADQADDDLAAARAPAWAAWGAAWAGWGAASGAWACPWSGCRRPAVSCSTGRPPRGRPRSCGWRTARAGRGHGRGAKDVPSVAFPIAGPLSIPSRQDPQLLEVARIELPAEYHAKATPVLTPRVFRLAKLTNTSDRVLLPGEATVYVGNDFVGRTSLPLVAAGEPFLAGFGVDPQVQVSRRLIQKSRSVQGGNQVFAYEFRIGLRNYRDRPVKVQLWDRLPKPQGEAVAVNFVKTSHELSTDALYQRTARLDNLLRWDITVPPGTVGEKTIYLNYQFRLEYARDLPQPRFVSGGLGEQPIGGAMGGGMGGMGGGMRSVGPGAR